ncbi:MAG: hypothetical protein M1827_003388 [Pycnora praestabilis]|nr:MAG: hypothetical protein M1827_003388 [Pycnora praestabilis]
MQARQFKWNTAGLVPIDADLSNRLRVARAALLTALTQCHTSEHELSGFLPHIPVSAHEVLELAVQDNQRTSSLRAFKAEMVKVWAKRLVLDRFETFQEP